MIKKSITYNVFEEKDIVEIVSSAAGKPVGINEMDVVLTDCLPLDDMEKGKVNECGMYLEIYVDDEEVPIDEEYQELPGVLLNTSYIFDFDTKKFKSFERYPDTSD